jgi:predicted lipid-binding transport protein (Tim44 family)
MYARLSRYVRVYVTERQVEFVHKYQKRFPMLQTQFDVEDIATAQTLASKGVLVRKKLDTDTQFNLNKSIRFDYGNK